MKPINRRQFLQRTSSLAAVGASTSWLGSLSALQNAAAQSSGSDYKALVCIFLSGGNDAHNTVIPVDDTSWRCYSASRDPSVMAQVAGITPPDNVTSIALAKSSLLNIGHRNAKGLNTGRSFALHPQLKRIQTLYTRSQAAIVANVGPLIQPTTKVDLLDLSYPLPAKLFSHNDQTSTWQSFDPEGGMNGWGGMMMDRLSSLNANKTFSAIGIDTSSVWLNGQTVMPYMLGSSGFQIMGGNNGQAFGSDAVFKAVRSAASTNYTSDLITGDYQRMVNRALDSESVIKQNLPDAALAPWGTPGRTAKTDPLLFYTDPNDGTSQFNPLAQQLQLVARMLSARNNSGIGANRQIFMVSMGGFDQHSNLLSQHGSLMARLDHAVDFFQKCLTQMPGGDMRSQVTTFTASEFGRALVNNGNGCDHGWGGHHFVIGGAVKGGDVYGRFPQFMAFDSEGEYFSDQLLKGGVLLPEISVDQLVYTLGKWMGVAESDLIGTSPGTGITPHIGNFEAADRDIGFMA
ncbi:MAG TPA: DUF1501 domain-containing protein [Aquabacterium sp.]|uniref:DUF1501 domain-containing protein n=1 Tax=Aquabacterium sp. TaxID=1872578 RepID=UPI002E30FB5E|nr:DUF1501 domain-containing protein [Aquabacterium sp.]HEX5356136.1 DUF1501 domain-containing protein [Aquabacterium sp.]